MHASVLLSGTHSSVNADQAVFIIPAMLPSPPKDESQWFMPGQKGNLRKRCVNPAWAGKDHRVGLGAGPRSSSGHGFC